MTLEQHGLELHGSTYMQVFPVNILEKFLDIYDHLKNIFFSLTYFIVRIQYVIYIPYKVCVNQPSVLLVRLLVNRKLFIVRFLQS